jgi:hypothetical protein
MTMASARNFTDVYFLFSSKESKCLTSRIMKINCVWSNSTRLHIFIEFIKQCPYNNMVCIVKHKLSLWASLPYEIYTAMCTEFVVVGSWMQNNLIFHVHFRCDRQEGVVLLSNHRRSDMCVAQWTPCLCVQEDRV